MQNSTWQAILRINNIFLVLSVGALLLSFSIAITSWSTYGGFFYLMLYVISPFLLFCFIEYRLYKDFKNIPESGLDSAVLVFICIRNGITLINVIPFIQLLGLMVVLFLPIIYLFEVIFLVGRYAKNKKVAPVASPSNPVVNQLPVQPPPLADNTPQVSSEGSK